MVGMEPMLATTILKIYRNFENLFGKIDFLETFIEPPKNLELQSATRSDCKHHNTSEFLVFTLRWRHLDIKMENIFHVIPYSDESGLRLLYSFS